MAKIDLGYAAERAKRSLDGFTRGQKTMLALAGVVVLLGGYMVTKWSSQPTWATLYSNLPASEAAAVTQNLDSAGVKYQLTGGGTAIQVPKEAVYRTRLDMSAKGLPSDGAPGYSLLDKQGITTSEFRQRVDYQRALEGELGKTIRSIDGVNATSVHLVIPQEDLFSADASKPSASVLISTLSGRSLSGSQVQAVVHLVASSVEGLSPDDVTVADSTGRVLAAPGQDGQALASTRAEETRNYEDTLARSLQDMVQKVTGDGHAVVKVSAEMDFNKRSTLTETYADPTKRTATAERSTKEKFTGPGAGSATGVLGPNGVATATAVTPTPTTVAGAATTPATAAAASASDYTKEEVQADYAVGKVTETVDATPGTVSKLSIAVLLDGAKKVDATKLSTLVAAAAGLNTTRGDKIEVGQLPFDQTGAKQAATELALVNAAKQKSQLFDLIKAVLLGLIALFSVFLAYRGAKKSTARTVTPIPLDELPTGARALMPGDDDETDDDRLAAIALGAIGALDGDLRALPGGAPRPDIAALIEKQPQDVANTLRDWLADRRS